MLEYVLLSPSIVMRQKSHTEISKCCVAARGRLLFILIFISCLAVISQAASGDLDTTFGGPGIVVTDVNNVSNEGRAMALQPEGKIIVGGSGVGFTMVRYKAMEVLIPPSARTGSSFIRRHPMAELLMRSRWGRMRRSWLQDSADLLLSAFSGLLLFDSTRTGAT